jgi:hypothetical protein
MRRIRLRAAGVMRPGPRPGAALAGLALAGALAGCAASGLPATTVAVPAQAGAQGQAETVIRAFLPGPGDDRREVGGAECEVNTILFRTRVVTPARLVFPSYGAQSPTLVIACRAGDLSGQAEQAVVTRWVRPPGGGAWGAWGGGWGAGPWGWGGMGPGPWGWSGPSYPTFVYPDVAVILGGPVDSPARLRQGSANLSD